MKLDELKKGTYPGGVLVAATLETLGIRHAFGIPGTHNIELYDAFREGAVTPILITDEQSAGFMADGHARSGGGLACANVVPGAGVTHVLSGVGEALMDNVPLLVLTCGIRTDTGHKFQLHDIDQLAVLRPLCKGVFKPESGSDIPATLLTACKLATEGVPGPVAVEIPANHYMLTSPWDPAQLVAWRAKYQTPTPPASSEHVATVAAILRNAKQPHFHVGLGCADIASELTKLVERVGGVVTTTFSGKGAVSEKHPQWIWPGFGKACPAALQKIVDASDATIVIGARLGEVSTASFGITFKSPSVHLDIDPVVPNANFQADHPLVGDARTFVPALLAALADLPARDTTALRQAIAAAHDDANKTLRAMGDTSRVNPSVMYRAIQAVFPDDTIYTTDSGQGTFITMEHLRVTAPRRMLSPTDFSCMGYAIPSAIGAAFGHPGRSVVAMAGDGAILMTGLELLTAGQHGLPIAIFLLHDGELGQIASFQRVLTNAAPCSVLPDFDFAAFAASVGAEYLQWKTDAEADTVVKKAYALSQKGPVLVDVAIDYSQKTFFTKGVVKTNFARLAWKDRLRMIGRAVVRRLPGQA